MSETPKSEDELRTEVSNFLRRNFPQIQMHGGEASITDIDTEENSVTIQLGGACSGCGISPATTQLIKQRMVKEIPEINSVNTIVGMGMDDGGSGTTVNTRTPQQTSDNDSSDEERNIKAPF